MYRELFGRSPEKVDEYFGLEIEAIEDDLLVLGRALRPEGKLSNLGLALHDGKQTWLGLHPQVLNTPYHELMEICDLLSPSPGEHVVDMGAAYGRLGLVLHFLYPGVRFTGLEYVQERVEEGNRIFSLHGCNKAKIVVQDLSEEGFTLPPADYFFLYDFGQVSHIRDILKKFETLAEKKKFHVVARGKGTRSMIDMEFPWLLARESRENFTIYEF